MNYSTGFLDKNGREIYIGMQVRKTGTLDDYQNPKEFDVNYLDGVILVDGVCIEDYVPSGSKYATLEICR